MSLLGSMALLGRLLYPHALPLENAVLALNHRLQQPKPRVAVPAYRPRRVCLPGGVEAAVVSHHHQNCRGDHNPWLCDWKNTPRGSGVGMGAAQLPV